LCRTEAVDPGALIADKAFDADAFIAVLNDRAIAPVIPSKSNRKAPRPQFRPLLQTQSHRAFLQHARAFPGHATRYDKLAKTFLAGVQLACAAILLN
jgi:transposase